MKGLSKLWKQEPVTFLNFAIVPSQELVNFVEKTPAKFDKKSNFLEEESQATKTAKSIEIRRMETFEEVFCYI